MDFIIPMIFKVNINLFISLYNKIIENNSLQIMKITLLTE